jgi:hypothetical protein
MLMIFLPKQMVDVTDYSGAYSNGTQQSYFGAKPLSITQRTPERAGAMSSALCEGVVERMLTSKIPSTKKPTRRARTQAACLNSSNRRAARDCNGSPPAQAPLRFASSRS